MALIKKYKKYFRIAALIWSFCLVIFAMVYFLVISPGYYKRNEIEREFTQNQKDYDFAQQAGQEESKNRIKNEIENLQNNLDNYVLDYKQAADLTFDITRIANECKISSFNIQNRDVQNDMASDDPNNIFEKHFKVSFTAGFLEFARFLNMLERHQPVLFIDDFLLSRQSRDNTAYEVTLEITALILKQEERSINAVSIEKKAGNEF